MSHIWDEKPVIEDGDYAETGFGDVTLSMPTGNYEVRLDAWLEKVKVLLDTTEKENCDLLYKTLTAQNKLEAIEEHFKNRPMINRDNFYESDSWFIQLKKILQSSTQTMIEEVEE